MSDESQNQEEMLLPMPNPDLKSFERLVGAWKLSGEAQGQVTFEWMEGGFFLMQHVDLVQNGFHTRGIEIIGHERVFGATEESEDIKSRYYDSAGNTLDYVYEMNGNTLTIWGGEKGSPAYCKAQFSEDGDSMTGSWVWPGGGYSYTGTRIK
jgi:hypothetical protein